MTSCRVMVIESDADYGYEMKAGRRKVRLWSRAGWTDVDRVGHHSLPPGRYVSGLIQPPTGPLRVLGVCIPWRSAHVNTGRKDRKPWQDHHSYLRGLRAILEAQAEPFVVVGDYNQRVPRKWQPLSVYQALVDTFDGLAEIATGGEVPGLDSQLIDHLAHGPALRAVRVQGISRRDDTGKQLSDHDGAMVEVSRE